LGSQQHTEMQAGRESETGTRQARRDIVMLGIATAALLLFVGTGGRVMPQVLDAWLGKASAPDQVLVNALLLNIALIIFGWRRYAELEREVKERRKAEAQARLLAETDPLTGCYNRRSILDVSKGLFNDAARNDGEVAVLMLDLDKFKQINDLHGHRAGDRILVEGAKRIRALLPQGSVLARIGGDEMAAILPLDNGDLAQLEQLVVELTTEMARPFELEDALLETTVSIGIATTRDLGDLRIERPEDAIDPLLHRADLAMYHAKQHGRNRYSLFEPAMENEVRFRNQLEAGIRHGIRHGEFVPYYEQQIDIGSGKLVGFEMLARWQSPQLGLITPEVFIPIAEDIGVIAEMSETLIGQAIDDARQWDPDLTLSVNISPVQLRDPWFAQRLLRLMTEAGFPPSRLEIEITESALQENLPVVRSTLIGLKNQGVRISLDDFGTGYSNLARLTELPFDQIKIDRSFVMELARDNGNSSIVESIIALGRGLELPLIAEGIENAEVLESLRKLDEIKGQIKGQGYLYGRPEDAAATHERLAREHRLVERGDGPLVAVPEALTAEQAQDLARRKAG